MNDVFFCKRHRVTPKKKSEILQLTAVERVIFLHQPYNITSHTHSCCNHRPVVSISGAPDCGARALGFKPHVDQSNNQGVKIVGAIKLAVCSTSGSVQFISVR